ncbi:MAG: translation initiation inhibitor [Opitutaceae bacterium]|jgi:enamine deaminase RidA (YjgF/YER057c/UK114 family)
MLSAPALSVPRAPKKAAASGVARELTFTESALPGEQPSQPLHRLAARLREEHAGIIGLMVFGSITSRRLIEAAMQDALGAPAWPVLWVEGASCHGAALAGVQAFALAGGPVEPITVNGRVMASRYTIGGAELCWVGGALPDDTSAEPGLQTTQAFDALERALNAAGFALGDLVRTWCYNHELLKWYDEFNRARSARYRTVAFRTGSLPASTGISAANPVGAALVLAGLAVRPINAGCNAHEIGSPLQCPAPAYGSAFSRAVEIDLGTTRRVLISGTASIEPGGTTVWKNDIHHQVGLTMSVVGAILKSRGLGWNDTTRAIAYFKSPDFVPAFEHWCDEHDWETPPCINLHCDICRDDLLFELELDAEVSS